MQQTASRVPRFQKPYGQVQPARDYAAFVERCFRRSEERRDALAAFGPSVHSLLHKALPDSLVLTPRRLLDGPAFGKSRNLSFLGFVDAVRDDEPECAVRLGKQLDSLRLTARSLHDQMPHLKGWRDRLMAHYDDHAVLGSLGDLQHTADGLLAIVRGAETALGQAAPLTFSSDKAQQVDHRALSEIETLVAAIVAASPHSRIASPH